MPPSPPAVSDRVPEPLTVALWQTPYAAMGEPPIERQAAVDSALAGLDAAAAQARRAGADLLVTPEMVLTGYHRDPAWLLAVAQPANGPWAQAVAALARKHGIALVYGYPEAAPARQKPYNAVQALGPDGAVLGHGRKTKLYGALDAARFTPAPQPPAVFVFQGWRLGLLICYDVEFPEPVQRLAQQGADAVLVPTANMPEFDEVQLKTVPERAADNHLYLAYANACGEEAGLAYGGLSTVAGPEGQVLARAGRDRELLVVTLVPLGGARRTPAGCTGS